MRIILFLLLLASVARADMWLLRDATTKNVILYATRSDGYIPEQLDLPNSEVVKIVQLPAPVDGVDFDSATQKFLPDVSESGTNPIVQTRAWQIVSLTQDEVDEITDAATRKGYQAQLASFIQTLQNKSSQYSNNNPANAGEALTAVNLMLDDLSQLYDRLAKYFRYTKIDKVEE